MEQPLYRKKTMDRISSPEQLNDYLKVTDPLVWLLLIAVIILLAGMLFWGTFTSIHSYVNGTGQVEQGTMTIRFEDSSLAANVTEGMTVTVGDTVSRITSVGQAGDGTYIATADSGLADGSYPVRVTYRRMQIIKLLFN